MQIEILLRSERHDVCAPLPYQIADLAEPAVRQNRTGPLRRAIVSKRENADGTAHRRVGLR